MGESEWVGMLGGALLGGRVGMLGCCCVRVLGVWACLVMDL